MPRQSRIVIPGIAHHVTQRGNYRQNIFDKENNYKQYCEWIDEYALKYKVDILAYCLMRNHVHFIVTPSKEDSLARMFNTLHMRYAHYLNRQRQVKGHLWQGRFYSCILDDSHLYRAIRYVEKNPLRAKIVKEAENYKWSSAQDHLGLRKEKLIKLTSQNTIIDEKKWKDYLKEDDIEMNKEMILKTNQGLVVGSNKFIKKLEKKLKRSLTCLKQGRPRKDV